MLRHFLALAALATTLHAAQLPDFAALPEHPVSQPAIGQIAAVPNLLHAASNGSEFFFIWNDLRSNPWGEKANPNTPAAFGARVDENGQMLDTADIPLPFADHVFWSGSVWIVTADRNPDAFFIRIARDGTVLDPVPRLIAGHGVIAGVEMERLLLVRTYAPFTAAVFDLQGQALTSDLYYFSDRGSLTGLQVVWNGNAFVIALSADKSPYTGAPEVETTVSAVDVHGNLAWQKVIESTQSVMGMSNDGAGTTLLALTDCSYVPCSVGWIPYDDGGNAGTMRQSTGPRNFGPMIWDGQEFLLTLANGGTLLAYPIRPDGSVPQASMPLLQGALGDSIAGASNGRRTLVATRLQSGSTAPIVLGGVAFAPLSAPTQRFSLGRGANPQSDPVVASNDRMSLVVWRELDLATGTFSIQATRLGANGAVLDDSPIRVAPMPCGVFTFAAASDGSDFMIVVQRSGGVSAWRVSGNGAVLDSQPIAVPGRSLGAPCGDDVPATSIASNGKIYVITSTANADTTLTNGLVSQNMTRVSTSGTVLDPTPFVLVQSQTAQRALVASNGDDFAVAWFDGGVFTLRLAADGTPIDSTPYPLMKPNGLDALFWDGLNYVAAGHTFAQPSCYSYSCTPYASAAHELVRFPAKHGDSLDIPDGLKGLHTDISDRLPERVGCDASGCAAIGTRTTLGQFQDSVDIVATPFTDTPNGLTGASSPLWTIPWQLGNEYSPEVQWIGGGAPRFAYQRPDPASGGVMRVFIRSQHERARAAGH